MFHGATCRIQSGRLPVRILALTNVSPVAFECTDPLPLNWKFIYRSQRSLASRILNEILKNYETI